MKTKTMAMSIAFTFLGTALFAQNKTDTVPQQPKTDTAQTPKTDTTKASAFVIKSVNVRSFPVAKDTVPEQTQKSDSTQKTDTSKATAFALNSVNVRSFSSNALDTVPQTPKTDSTEKKDTTNASALVGKSSNKNDMNEDAAWINEQTSVAYLSSREKMKKSD
ncbi:MAG TPA: hypothetical protein VFU62_11885 [Hanamia sp.]|jgi:hypothetical protein|nr:hypothetical protein [Hanamia sp.]